MQSHELVNDVAATPAPPIDGHTPASERHPFFTSETFRFLETHFGFFDVIGAGHEDVSALLLHDDWAATGHQLLRFGTSLHLWVPPDATASSAPVVELGWTHWRMVAKNIRTWIEWIVADPDVDAVLREEAESRFDFTTRERAEITAETAVFAPLFSDWVCHTLADVGRLTTRQRRIADKQLLRRVRAVAENHPNLALDLLLTRIDQRAPCHPVVLGRAVQTAIELERYDDALLAARKCLEHGAHHTDKWVQALLAAGRADDAAAHLEALRSLDSSAAAHLIGDVYAALGDADAALAARIDHDRIHVWPSMIARLDGSRGAERRASARALLEHLDETDQPGVGLALRVDIARSWAERGDLAAAATTLDEARHQLPASLHHLVDEADHGL